MRKIATIDPPTASRIRPSRWTIMWDCQLPPESDVPIGSFCAPDIPSVSLKTSTYTVTHRPASNSQSQLSAALPIVFQTATHD